MTTNAPASARDGISKTLAGTRIAETQITPDARHVSQRKTRKTRRKMMIVREISPKWFRLDVEGLVFFGYSREHVRHKLEAWVREHDLQRLRSIR